MQMITPDWLAPAHIHALTTTRHTDMQALHLPSAPVWLHQIHGTNIIDTGAKNFSPPQADGAYTQQKNIICAVRTADCLPILLSNLQGSFVAAVHAGWRGLAGGIIEAALQKSPAPAHTLLAWLGPAISAEAYEVGEEVYQSFPDDTHAFQPISGGKYFCSLSVIAKMQLEKLGVKLIYGGFQYCTYRDTDLFYSYRRDNTVKARMSSLIWMS